ncbi:MAG: SIS domain-containing protein [Lachnospiraceae bacterium]|nr:SIS domain-containing protein [Lachnospiraceae bacterium]MBF1011589.1 SIS domain-containing protein [Lachnospiraceae bacterium]
MTTEGAKALQVFEDAVRQQVEYTLHAADKDAIGKAAEIIQASIRQGGRLHVTGIGKPGHIAGYIASLITSTGTPAYFLHGTEAVHGSSGQLVAGDVVIAISNSGNTDEMMATVFCAQDNGCKIIGVTGNAKSRLAGASDVVLLADVVPAGEGGPLNRAPRNSILAETLVMQMLSVVLQAEAHVTPEEYVKHHPHGALGKLREDER